MALNTLEDVLDTLTNIQEFKVIFYTSLQDTMNEDVLIERKYRKAR